MPQHPSKTKKAKSGRRTKKSQSSNISMGSNDWLYGLHAIESALSVSPCRIKNIWLLKTRQDDRMTTIKRLAEQQQVMVHLVSNETLTNRFGDITHQGVVAEANPITAMPETVFITKLGEWIDSDTAPLFLILDGVQDPHNLGACLRTAEAAGVNAVIAPKDRASGLTATVLKVAAGSAERIPFVAVTNLARLLRELHQMGVWLVGTGGESEHSLYDTDLTVPVAIILGAEGKGIRRLTREHCDQIISIPMIGQTESLNVSVATGVCLFEALRQRTLSK